MDPLVVAANHMRDLMRGKPIPFDGKGIGLEAETWLIALE